MQTTYQEIDLGDVVGVDLENCTYLCLRARTY